MTASEHGKYHNKNNYVTYKSETETSPRKYIKYNRLCEIKFT